MSPDPRAALRSAAHGLLDLVRRGDRTVLWTEGYHMGVGNHLYLWLWADIRVARGEDTVVLRRPTMDAWLPHFPDIAPLVIDRAQVGLADRRVVDSPQRFGIDFTADELAAFVERRVRTAPAIAAVDPAEVDPDRLVVNSRRGGYDSTTKFRGASGLDLDAYVQTAGERAAADRRIGSIHVVSDGIDWCRARLGWLADHAPLTFAEGETPLQNLVTVATARRLLLTNSTFSYWGGYISNVLHGDNHADVYAPWFHARTIANGRAYQLDPRWTIIDDIPGGWDS